MERWPWFQIRLYLMLVELQKDSWNTDDLAKEWDGLVARFPNALALWEIYMDTYEFDQKLFNYKAMVH